MARENLGLSIRVLGLATLLMVAAACETLQVGSDYDRAASFSGFHTFVIMPRQRSEVSNPLVVQRTEDAIRSYLVGRGYQYVGDPAKADFAVDFTIGSRERTDIQTYPQPWGGPWATGPGGWYGTPGWTGPYWGNAIDVRQYTEGTLSIDVFDDRTNRPVWHGWARKTLSQSDIENSAEPIRGAVAAVLEKFPPQTAS
jgi:hypothetical protein